MKRNWATMKRSNPPTMKRSIPGNDKTQHPGNDETQLVASPPSPPDVDADLEPEPARTSLVGRWKDPADESAYEFTKDDGKDLEAVCETGCDGDYRWSGSYVSADRAKIVTTHPFPPYEGCESEIRIAGTLTVLSVDVIEISNEEYESRCAKSTADNFRLQRQPG